MLKRTIACGDLRDSHIGSTVTLSGWVNSYRDHGGLIFIDLRDRVGIAQVVFDSDDIAAEMAEAADKLRNEDVISITGSVRTRTGGANPKLVTGTVEVVATELEVLAKTDNPPFLPDDSGGGGKLPNEEVRLKHRYIDLRRPKMQQMLALRHRTMQITRRYFDENGFLEVETPILYKSTPEGAREFIIPSRHVPGGWYALPQSPQLFKQILMVAGCERYMQICRCFRDEDPRADRQAEFSQIDLEMAFVEREDVMVVMEGFVRRLWKEILGFEVPPIERMTYREAMDRFGIDRPDTRYGLELHDVSDLAAQTQFGVFQTALAKGRGGTEGGGYTPDSTPGAGGGIGAASKLGVVKAIVARSAAEKLTRKILDGYSEFAKGFGAGGIPYTKVVAGEGSGALKFETGIAKFLEPIAAQLIDRLNLQLGDVVLFGADTYTVATKALGELRQKVARDLGLVPEWGKAWNFLWVVDFPMFERDKESGRWVAMHHPFTAPRTDQQQAFLDAAVTDEQTIAGIVSAGYDIVCNGSEIAGGSVRIHNRDVQAKVFQLLGLSEEQAKDKFSFLLEALRFGAPPHGGIAFGLDRLIMHLLGTDNIRDVIAFPKTQIGADLMTQAPGPVTEEQLKEVHLRQVVK